MRSAPLSLYLVTFSGLTLAVMMTWEGLIIQLFGEARDPGALWLQGSAKLGIEPVDIAWPLIVLGISWIGVIIGLWLRLPWGRKAGFLVSVLSLFYFPIGTILASIALIGNVLPATGQWLKEDHAPERN